MPAGALREKVTFQRRSAVNDGYGNTTTGDWADIAGLVDVPADLTPLRQGEAVLAEGIKGRRVYRVSVRQTSALLTVNVSDRMIDARDPTRVFNVKAPPINPDKRSKYLEFLVESGGASG